MNEGDDSPFSPGATLLYLWVEPYPKPKITAVSNPKRFYYALGTKITYESYFAM
ncbi:MAG: hypothetical protein M5U34_37265 [Chloroflexi bacterium]|nr:hypothetical protein [Chloroflexota bacterium]